MFTARYVSRGIAEVSIENLLLGYIPKINSYTVGKPKRCYARAYKKRPFGRVPSAKYQIIHNILTGSAPERIIYRPYTGTNIITQYAIFIYIYILQNVQ